MGLGLWGLGIKGLGPGLNKISMCNKPPQGIALPFPFEYSLMLSLDLSLLVSLSLKLLSSLSKSVLKDLNVKMNAL